MNGKVIVNPNSLNVLQLVEISETSYRAKNFKFLGDKQEHLISSQKNGASIVCPPLGSPHSFHPSSGLG